RREIRLTHRRLPAGAVALTTCQIAIEDALWFQERISAGPTMALSSEQLRAMLDDRALHAEQADRWTVRREGFGHMGRLDLTAAAAVEGPDYGAFVHGHLMRWMVEEDVPFRPHMLGSTSFYAASITRNLVLTPAEHGDGVSPLVAHARAIKHFREEGPVPLADELVLMAWLMDQRGFGVRLAGYLDARDRQLAVDRRT